jgi:N6-adenosine-specific RNA methylase IME4/ParB-like chromosome segregation protein Spo0J
MRFSTASELFPLMTEAEFEELTTDMRRHGQREPIVLDREGRILDGRNRYRACKTLAMEPKYTTVDTDDPVAYVLSENLHRRHLSESQRAMVAARVAKLRRGNPMLTADEATNPPIGGTDAVTQTGAAQTLKVGERSVQRARQVLDHGTPELVQAVDAGQMPVGAAVTLARTPAKYQRAVVEKVAAGVRPTEAKRQVKAEEIAARGPSELPDRKYRVVYADPPWSYGNTQPDYHPEQRDHYPVMSMAEVCALPVRDIIEEDAVLFLWVTSPILAESFQVVSAWGFTYKASFVWDKVKHNMGHYNSVRHEFLLICVRGSCQPDQRKLFDSVVSEERTAHSVKPVRFYEIIETLYPYGRRVELFARASRPGWDAWGLEI